MEYLAAYKLEFVSYPDSEDTVPDVLSRLYSVVVELSWLLSIAWAQHNPLEPDLSPLLSSFGG